MRCSRTFSFVASWRTFWKGRSLVLGWLHIHSCWSISMTICCLTICCLTICCLTICLQDRWFHDLCHSTRPAEIHRAVSGIRLDLTCRWTKSSSSPEDNEDDSPAQCLDVVGRVDGWQLLDVVSYDEVFPAITIFRQLHSNWVVSINHSKPFQVSISPAFFETWNKMTLLSSERSGSWSIAAKPDQNEGHCETEPLKVGSLFSENLALATWLMVGAARGT